MLKEFPCLEPDADCLFLPLAAWQVHDCWLPQLSSSEHLLINSRYVAKWQCQRPCLQHIDTTFAPNIVQGTLEAACKPAHSLQTECANEGCSQLHN